MVDTELIRTIVGIIGNIISFCLFASPIPTFMRICKNKAVENFKPDPYLATVLNCALWTFYGLPFVHPHSILVVTINSLGLFMELIYVSIFFAFCNWAMRKRIIFVMLVEIVFAAVVIILTMGVTSSTTVRSAIVGIICIIFNIIMYAAPLTVMRRVIKTKSVKYMPFALSLANFLNGGIWVAYALLKFDLFIVIPNALGTLSGLVQILLYIIYYKSTNWDDDVVVGAESTEQRPAAAAVQPADENV